MLIFWIGLPLLIIDQLTKFLILRYMQPGQSLPLIRDIFHLTFVCNKGIAFGLFPAKGELFIWTSLVVILVIIFIFSFFRKGFAERKNQRLFLSLILAGAIGNLIDRIRFGYVVDFLDFRIWPVFNIADSAITVGAILLVYSMLKKPETRNQKPEKSGFCTLFSGFSRTK